MGFKLLIQKLILEKQMTSHSVLVARDAESGKIPYLPRRRYELVGHMSDSATSQCDKSSRGILL